MITEAQSESRVSPGPSAGTQEHAPAPKQPIRVQTVIRAEVKRAGPSFAGPGHAHFR